MLHNFVFEAKKQMEEQLSQLIDENAALSGIASLDTTLRPESMCLEDAWDGSPNTSLSSMIGRRSMMTDNLENGPRMRLVSDGATRFLHHQIIEVANGMLFHMLLLSPQWQMETLEMNSSENENHISCVCSRSTLLCFYEFYEINSKLRDSSKESIEFYT